MVHAPAGPQGFAVVSPSPGGRLQRLGPLSCGFGLLGGLSWRMTLTRPWALGAGLLLATLGLAAAALAWWLPSNAVLAQRTSAALGATLGVPVQVGSLEWQLLPTPRLVLNTLRTSQTQPITVEKITVRLDVPALLQRRVQIRRADVVGAVVHQVSLGVGQANNLAKDATPAFGGFQLHTLPLTKLVFRNVTWVPRNGIAVVYDGQLVFDANWRPRTAQLQRPGAKATTELSLTREGDADRWAVQARVGGGTLDGNVTLTTDGQPNAEHRLVLSGQLQPRGIEVAQALAAFNRQSVVTGPASGETTLSAQGAHVGELVQSLQTRTSFTLQPATLLKFDLDKTIRSAGRDTAGQTRLDTVTGQLATRNTPTGMVVQFSQVQARSGALSAAGQATLANRQIDAELAVDLVGGLVGIPLRVRGPMGKPQVSVPPGAVAGAVVGTAVLPGVGTAIGARVGSGIGGALDKLFGNTPASPPSAPRKPE